MQFALLRYFTLSNQCHTILFVNGGVMRVGTNYFSVLVFLAFSAMECRQFLGYSPISYFH